MTRTLADDEAPHRRITVAEVRAHRDEVLEIGARHGVTSIRVFGSVARDEADDRSDLDLLVAVEPGRNLLDLASFAVDIEDLLGVFTQVVTERGLKTRDPQPGLVRGSAAVRSDEQRLRDVLDAAAKRHRQRHHDGDRPGPGA